MNKIPHYPKIYNLGNDAIDRLFVGEVEVTEKIDGSQFGFGIDKNDDLLFRSKGVQLFSKDQNGMFAIAVEQVEKRYENLLALRKEFIEVYNNPDLELYFYGEYLNKPKHNVLKYDRVPKDNIMTFGFKTGEHWEFDYDILKKVSNNNLGFETVPLIHRGLFENDRVAKSEFGNPDQTKRFGYTAYEKLKAIIYGTQSVLGGTLIEGTVIKNYKQICSIGAGTDPQFGKYVREDFKEALHKEWGNISGKNALQEFIDAFKAEARWNKAVQHLRENGELTNSPKDIGPLMNAIKKDVAEEELENIKKFLAKYFMPDILRRSSAGFPEWYKDQLMKKQFEDK